MQEERLPVAKMSLEQLKAFAANLSPDSLMRRATQQVIAEYEQRSSQERGVRHAMRNAWD